MWRLADPWYLILLVLPAALLALRLWSNRRGRASVLFSGGSYLHGLPRSWRAAVSPHLHWLRYPGLVLLIFALTRPQSGQDVQEIQTFAVDIMLVMDVSGTMKTEDMVAGGRQVSRIEAAKTVMAGFIEKRQSDRLGLIAFGTYSLTRCPLTVDYTMVMSALREIDINLFPKDLRRTAIGNALATAVGRLHKSDAKSKVVILLTDGDNTAGNIAPISAAEIAESENVKVYTIGFGSPGRTDVNEQVLHQIATKTGGRFFRSESLADLERVYAEIDELEKSEVTVKNYQLWDEWFQWFLWSGCLLLMLEVMMNQIVCRKVPA
ncbi:VWA domain-containing protein [Sulfidibacter corallicola]|uniref:VWA domain-containing protein n=1 Tax=Sulfidibacter corallicola TaxID=2818388 RepID=A0A8A4TN93_SULCO|nr:VWA domain-containing protein [Sulfidibacter corallicola]QTD51023.1 VWA domain-containing protein [Sulfidibacter corallicola]